MGLECRTAQSPRGGKTGSAYPALATGGPSSRKPRRHLNRHQWARPRGDSVAMPAGMDEMDASYERETAPVWLGQRNLTEALAAVGTEWRRLLHQSSRPT